jgi:hypothetical protein
VDFELNEQQRAIVEAAEVLLARHAGAARAVKLDAEREADSALEAALDEAGFLDVALGDETGFLEAALVTEAVARAGGCIPIGARALVAPGLLGRGVSGPVAVASAAIAGPVRFAAEARTLLLDTGEEARIFALESGDAQRVRSNFMFPMGRLQVDAGRGEALGPGSGERLRAWWRTAVAAEAVGAMRAALDVTVAYVKRRRQFGRAIGSFQAVQHRLAHCAVRVEAARWLVYETAYDGAPAAAAAATAAYVADAAEKVHAETHQLTGAMGFTREHDLHVWSMRLQALRLEAGGLASHRIAAARERWA